MRRHLQNEGKGSFKKIPLRPALLTSTTFTKLVRKVNENSMDDEDIRLPDDTQRILNEFLSEQAKQQQQDNVVSENWNLSQFW